MRTMTSCDFCEFTPSSLTKEINLNDEFSNGVPSSSSSPPPVVRHVDGTNLTLHHVHRTDMGSYMCIASNRVPPAISKRFQVKVNCEFHPQFISSLTFSTFFDHWTSRIDFRLLAFPQVSAMSAEHTILVVRIVVILLLPRRRNFLPNHFFNSLPASKEIP